MLQLGPRGTEVERSYPCVVRRLHVPLSGDWTACSSSPTRDPGSLAAPISHASLIAEAAAKRRDRVHR